MKRTFFQRLAAGIASLALLTGTLCTTAFADVTVDKATPVGGADGTGTITVTVLDKEPGATGTGSENNNVGGEPVGGVGINALRIGDVVELTTTDDSTDPATTTTQVAFGISDEAIITLLGLGKAAGGTYAPIASDTTVSPTVYYYAPTVVQNALDNVNKNPDAVESFFETNKDDYSNDIKNQITDNTTGAATFSNISNGLYLLAKSKLPAESTTDLLPFLVSLPMYQEGTGGAPDTWNSSVYAYPKVRTSKIEITKSADEFVAAGEEIEYTLNVTIPDANTTTPNNFETFTITDTNTNSTLDIDGTTLYSNISVEVKTGTDANVSPTELTPQIDYTVTYDPGTTGSANGVLTIEFTQDGRNELYTLLDKDNSKVNDTIVTVTYKATVDTSGDFAHELVNSAKVDYKRENAEPGSDTAEVKVYTHGIDLTKILNGDTGNTTIGENDITFELYTNEDCTSDHAVKVTEATTISTTTRKAYWKAPDGAATMSVGTDGKLYLYGLDEGIYYLKETATKSGYALLSEPIKIEITGTDADGTTPAKSEVQVNDATNATDISDTGIVTLQVENTQTTLGFTLPATGGAGTLMATAIGLGLLALAVVLLVVYRKKNREQ